MADGGFQPGPTKEAFPELIDKQIQLSGRHEPGSRRTRKRRAEMRIWTGWSILAYDLDTLAIRTR